MVEDGVNGFFCGPVSYDKVDWPIGGYVEVVAKFLGADRESDTISIVFFAAGWGY